MGSLDTSNGGTTYTYSNGDHALNKRNQSAPQAPSCASLPNGDDRSACADDSITGKSTVEHLRDIRAHLNRFASPDLAQAFSCLAQTVAVFAFCFWAYAQVNARCGSSSLVCHLLKSAIALLEAGTMVRAFILFHDCTHESFFKSKRANFVLGTLLSPVVLTSWPSWRKGHLDHHHIFGKLPTEARFSSDQADHVQDVIDQTDTIVFTKQEFDRMPPRTRLFWRFFRDPIVFFSFFPLFQWFIEYPFIRRHPSVLVGQVIHILISYYVTPYHHVALYISGIAGVMLFHLQHAVNTGYRAPQGTWNFYDASLYGSTYLPIPWPLSWFTLGIEFHHIHHANTRVPSYRLAQCHFTAPKHFWKMVTRVPLSLMWTSLWNVMWDDEKQIFVPF